MNKTDSITASQLAGKASYVVPRQILIDMEGQAIMAGSDDDGSVDGDDGTGNNDNGDDNLDEVKMLNHHDIW